MSDEAAQITLQDIANRTGFCRSTISLALRGDPTLPPATRRQIVDAAKDLNYQPNPLVAALMRQVRRKRKIHRETFALMTRHGLPISRREEKFYQILYRAVVSEAAHQGLAIDEFDLDGEISDARLTKILKTRGIHGVIFFPGFTHLRLEYPDLEWSSFAAVLIGFDAARVGLHQVVSDYAYDIDLALSVAIREGCRRIGFAIAPELDRATNRSWQARYLLYQHAVPARERVPLLPANRAFSEEVFLTWFHRHRPDVVILAQGQVYSWLVKAGFEIPRDVRVINLVQRGELGLAGIDPLTAEVGKAAVSLLASLMQENNFGLPDYPRVVSIKGRWKDGKSFPIRCADTGATERVQ